MYRLKTRPQFQAAMAGGIVSRTAHFALHRLGLDGRENTVAVNTVATPGSDPVPVAPAGQALFVVAACDAQGPWLGVMAPKRWAKRSVTRHAIKRQIYEIGDAIEAQLPTAAYVVRLRSGFDRKLFPSATSDALKAAVRQELQQLFAYAARKQRPAPKTGAAP